MISPSYRDTEETRISGLSSEREREREITCMGNMVAVGGVQKIGSDYRRQD